MPDWLATFLSLLAGSVLAIGSGWVSDRRSAARDREKREAEYRERLIGRRDEFQRETLLQLQDAAMRLLRATGAALHADTMAFRSTGRWQRQKLGEDQSEGHRLAVQETLVLATRVRDEQVRELADALRIRCSDTLFSESELTGQQAMLAAAATHGELTQRIGELVRQIDDPVS